MGRILIGLVLIYLVCGCTTSEPEASQVLAGVIADYEDFKVYDREEYPLGLHTDSIYRIERDAASSWLDRLETINGDDLSETEWISWEMLRFILKNEINAYDFRMHFNPIQSDQGFHLNLNYRIRPLLSETDAERYLKLLAAIPAYTEQHFTLLRKGLEMGISQPKVIFEGYASTYDTHIVSDASKSAFFTPFESLPETISAQKQDSLKEVAIQRITNDVVPSFEKIKRFFEEEYIPKTRDAIGVSATPNGRGFYQNRIDYYTTSEAYDADKIHQLGLAEVKRIRGEMEGIIADLGFTDGFDAFLGFLRTDPQFYAETGDALLMHARNIAKKIDAQLPKYFKTLPRKPYGVIKVPDAIAPKYTGGRYSGTSKDTEPGYYLVNTYKLNSRPLYVLPSLTAHEAVPGHHLQGALNLEMGDSIPNFRKRTYLSAYGEGWALYTEFLADEMGIYETPYEQFGKLTYEMWRACRLVVDTGIHAKGWSKQQVLDFMLANTALSVHEVNTETDRYIAWPGQALSYKIGELKIRELRTNAESQMGNRFDIREFHEIVLEQGTVTLPILERRIRTYMNSNND
ncbi:DUF885 domain-containing protein [Flagellimonas sp. DF-77]|uniref:DUF885 domain-containing protein n=1 Tax=Flagellimonas algarum TaxID=3230298 RepID=UPI003398FB7D